jgi:branched-chain amino acid transport system permease protein
MFELLSVSQQALFGQLLLGLINGSFYAMLSLGLAIIFGLLSIINFTHGAQYMLGAFTAWMLLNYLGIGYWWALFLAPAIVGLIGILIERLLLSRLYHLDHLYGLLLTFGIALVIQGVFRHQYGISGLPYGIPAELSGGRNLGFMFLPNYRAWVVLISLVVCIATWLVIEKTRLGAYLRAATENPTMVGAFGINVPRLVTLTYGFGVALAAFAGVLAAPIYSVNPDMGADTLIIVFAVVVIGGMGSILGAIVTGFGLGLIEAITRLFYPEGSTVVIFAMMALVILMKPATQTPTVASSGGVSVVDVGANAGRLGMPPHHAAVFIALLGVGIVAPFLLSPVFVMKVLCFALFAAAFNLLLGYGGLLSFGHAAYFGSASYICAYTAKTWGLTPELAILSSVIVAAGLGFAIGALAIRRQGIYFAMVTLAFAQMIYFVAVKAPFTGGEDGIQAVPRGRLFGLIDITSDQRLYVVVLLIVLGGLLAIYRIVHSPFGQILKSIRENEPRAVSLGYRVNQYKLLVFILSATFAGLAGATKALVFQFASLTDVNWTMSGEVVLITLLGGMGTVFGPVAGAALLETMQNYLAGFGAWVMIIQGLFFVVAVMSFREGIVGILARFFRKPLLRRCALMPLLRCGMASRA